MDATHKLFYNILRNVQNNLFLYFHQIPRITEFFSKNIWIFILVIFSALAIHISSNNLKDASHYLLKVSQFDKSLCRM